MYDDIALFVHIAQNGSLSATANRLGIPAATITRRLQKLEAKLSCQLINRSARQFALTPEGEVYYQAYSDLIEQLESTQRVLSAEVSEMSGKLKVLAPTNISIGFLQPMWSSFIKKYPAIKLEIDLNNQIVDFISTKADIALRIGPQPDSSLYQKRLGTLSTILVASPSYLQQHGEPKTIEDLKKHALLGSKKLSYLLHNVETGQQFEIFFRSAAVINDLSLITKLVCDGIGISLLPITEVKKDILNGKIKQILPSWQGKNRNIYAVWSTGKLLNTKAKCLCDYIDQYIKESLSENER